MFGGVTLSHWIMDFIMHSNLPLLFNNSTHVGIGLENSGPGFLLITIFDIVFLAVSIYIYFRAKKSASLSTKTKTAK